MKKIRLTDEEVQEIKRERYEHPDPRVQKRMDIVWLKHNAKEMNLTNEDIATLAGCSRRSVQRALASYLRGGLGALRQLPVKTCKSELDQHSQSLEDLFAKHPPRSLKHARHLIFEHTGIRRGLTQVRRFLHRIGLKPRKIFVIPVPPKKTVEEHARTQADFLAEKLQPKLDEAKAGQRRVFFVDAAHFVHATLIGYLWCKMRQAMRAASGRKRYNVLGALDFVTHQMISVTNHAYINALSVCELLRKVAADTPAGMAITLVLDNAKYQKCEVVANLAAQLGIELLYLPGYSPNLNLIERVWKLVKSECIRACYHENYESFHTSIQKCLEELNTKHKEAMTSLLTSDFQTFEDVVLLAA